ncbi:hypothetical protein RclHR1_05520012 [Rhizophagus clarus]|uniref:Protein kinase domain-containing protein n=1 Tax=Rhizophagus clarus TaxID=94130 RepID=A0A2Z6RNR8_9GLOM|nr:hypothetical protein RclHR1_05520012 [Rhizophagus clarus]
MKLEFWFIFKIMTEFRDYVWTAINRVYTIVDYNKHDNLEKRHEFRKQTILLDKYLKKYEKSEIIKMLTKDHDYYKILYNEGTKRTCENCPDKCFAELYCEHCVRNYLKGKFSNWTSNNNDIDDLIQKCQMEAISPHRIVEWIPYDSLQDVEYLTKGGCSEIYTATWREGQLKNVENASRNWFEESKSHLTISRHCKLLWVNKKSRKCISDLGFCGPADKPLNSAYGIISYIAPEVITGKKTTFESDIYSIGMLMWEISSGQPPFVNYKHDYDLAMKIVNGMRPKIIPGTPLKYKELMERCWDPDPAKRPDANTLEIEMNELLIENEKNQLPYFQDDGQEQIVDSIGFTNENCTKFHSNYHFSIPDNDIPNDHEVETVQSLDINDDIDKCDNLNFHS